MIFQDRIVAPGFPAVLSRLRAGLAAIAGAHGWGIGASLSELYRTVAMRFVVPWSRIFNNEEILAAISTNPDAALAVWVTLDNSLHPAGRKLTCLYSTDPHAIGTTISVESSNGKAVSLTVPAAGVVVYA